MAKRKVSSSFVCPRCQMKFDADVHAPFMGSCGHSLCGVCVNEKEIKDCPVCNKEGGFTWNQRNELAIEFLVSAAAERGETDSKEPLFFIEGEKSAPGEAVPAIIDPTHRAFLAKIVNQLDPKSFINLASSCKTLYNYCFHSNEIRIVYGNLQMLVCKSRGVYCFKLHKKNGEYSDYRPMNYTDELGFLGSQLNRKKLKNYPFVFKLQKLRIVDEFDEDFNKTLRSFLNEFPIETITRIEFDPVLDWDGFPQFLEDFKIKDVYDGMHTMYNIWADHSLPEDVATYILQNTDRFSTDSSVPDDLILNASVKELILPCTMISQATFMDLLKRFSNSSEDVNWKFGGRRNGMWNTRVTSFEFGHYDLFPVLPFNYEGPLPEERPLVFVKNPGVRFCVLRRDEKILECHRRDCDRGFEIQFSTCNSYGFPPVFPPEYYAGDVSDEE